VTLTTLFHWSPAERRQAIERDGLVPASASSLELRLPPDARWWDPPPGLDYVCLACSPRQAWKGCGDYGWMGRVGWDLWQVHLGPDDRVGVLYHGSRRPGDEGYVHDDASVIEVRVYHPLPPDRLWLVGGRTAMARGDVPEVV
jgi:hypothetical protein